MATKLARRTQLDRGKTSKEVELIEDAARFNKIRGGESSFDLGECTMPEGEQLLRRGGRLGERHLNLEGTHCVGENQSGGQGQRAHWLAREETSSWIIPLLWQRTWRSRDG